MDDTAARELKVGAVFLVPPKDGTYTPTPAPPSTTPTPTNAPTQTPAPSATPAPASETPALAAAAPGGVPEITAAPIITITPSVTATPLVVADAATAAPLSSRVSPLGGHSPWLWVAIGVQVVLIVAAGVELALRYLKR